MNFILIALFVSTQKEQAVCFWGWVTINKRQVRSHNSYFTSRCPRLVCTLVGWLGGGSQYGQMLKEKRMLGYRRWWEGKGKQRCFPQQFHFGNLSYGNQSAHVHDHQSLHVHRSRSGVMIHGRATHANTVWQDVLIVVRKTQSNFSM
jgi:hypothetical protein